MKKYTFPSALLGLSILLTTIMMALYPTVQNNVKYNTYDLGYYLQEAMTYFMMDQCEKLNPDYEMVSIDDSTSEEEQATIRDNLQAYMEPYINNLKSDNNFGYEVRYKDQVISKHMPKKQASKKALYYQTISYNAKGIETTDQYQESNYSPWGDLGIYSLFPSETQNKISFMKPQDITFTFFIPKNLVSNDKIVVSSLNTSDAYVQWLFLLLSAMSMLMILFALIYPLKKEIEAKPFSSLVKMKLETSIAFHTLVLICLISASFIVGTFTLSGALIRFLEDYQIPAGFAWAANVLVYTLSFFMIGSAIVSLKYYISKRHDGLKKQTVCYGIYRWLDRQVMSIQLSKGMNKNLLWFVFANTGILFLLLWLSLESGTFGFLLILIYGVALYIYLRKRFAQMQSDYQSLFDFTKDLSQGKFQENGPEDFGIFSDLGQELQSIQSSFESALNEGIKSQNLKTELITNVSHDLKTPLTGIKNYLELLQQEDLNDNTKEQYMKQLTNYANRLNTMVIDLLDVSKANSGNMDLHRQDIDVVEFIEQIHAENEDLLKDKGLRLVTNTPEKSCICSLDPNKSVRIFENLLSNISKYALENTRAFVDIKQKEDVVEITYKNISKNDLDFKPEEITERFMRGDTSRHESGSGLGLAIVKSFVELQGGTFHIEIDGDLFKAILQFPSK